MANILLATAVCAVVLQQGGGFGGQGGGFGGGGFSGGSMGGSSAGNVGDTETTKTHILTPGDKAEWPLELKSGDVLILRASSTNFDPAITVVDENNVKLAENDDEEPGMQNARLLVHFPKAGKYRALVSNYRSNAGGQYSFSMQRFTSIDGVVGAPATWKRDETESPTPAIRLRCEAGKIVAFRPKNGWFRRVIGPDGTIVDPIAGVQNRFAATAFKTKVAGDYFIQCQLTRSDSALEVRATVAKERTISIGRSLESAIGEGEIDVWRIATKKGELIELESKGAKATSMFLEDVAYDFDSGQGDGRWVDAVNKTQSRIVLNNTKDGEVLVYVGAPIGARSYTFSCRNASQPLQLGSPQSHRLVVGGAEYYAVDLKAGDVITATAKSKTFDSILKWLTPDGYAFEYDDGVWPSTDATQTMVIVATGRHYVGVASNGDGGGGDYEISIERIPAKGISIGQSQTGSPRSEVDSIWDIAVQDGKPISIRLTGDVRDGNWMLIGPNGLAVYPNEIRLSDSDRMFVLVKPSPGSYRLWLRGMKIGGNYTIKVDRFG